MKMSTKTLLHLKKTSANLWYTFMLVILLATVACRLQKEKKLPSDFKPGIVTFLDSTQASAAIIHDDTDSLFANISEADIMIQMKRAKNFVSLKEARLEYRHFLASQVSSWTTAEKQEMSSIMQIVKKMCDTLSPRIFPGGIRLVKIKTGPYGSDAYYTRGTDIMIPENIFPLADSEAQIPVMLHEIYHILSRTMPEFRSKTYKMIGFEKAGKPVTLPPALHKVLLSNPDGLTKDYVIRLKEGQETRVCLPLISSRFGAYREGIPSYFDYVKFDIFELREGATVFEVLSTEDGGTTLPVRFTTDYFRQISDNTQYIIHPDEILADNFMLSIIAFESGDYSKFSKQGRALIDSVTTVLKQF